MGKRPPKSTVRYAKAQIDLSPLWAPSDFIGKKGVPLHGRLRTVSIDLPARPVAPGFARSRPVVRVKPTRFQAYSSRAGTLEGSRLAKHKLPQTILYHTILYYTINMGPPEAVDREFVCIDFLCCVCFGSRAFFFLPSAFFFLSAWLILPHVCSIWGHLGCILCSSWLHLEPS